MSQDKGHELHNLFIKTSSSAFVDPVTGAGFASDKAFTFGDTRANQAALFANGGWRFTDTLKASLGARYTREHRNFIGCTGEQKDAMGVGLSTIFNVLSISKGGPGGIQKGDCFSLDDNGNSDPFRGTLTEPNVSGRVSLDWQPDDAFLFYVSYTRGFKSGGFPVANTTYQEQYEPVRQEKLLATEVGGKTSFFDRRLRANFAAFNYDYKDKQLLTRFLDPVFGPLPILRNAPRSKVRGVELDVQAVPVQGLFVTLAGSYIKTEIEEFVSTNINGQEQDFAGRPFNFAPKFQGTALADYTLPVPMSSSMEMGLGVDYSYTGTTNSTLEGDPLYKHDSFGMWGARARLSSIDGVWSVVAWGKNLTNEFSTVSIFQVGDAIARVTGQPRTYGLTLTYHYD